MAGMTMCTLPRTDFSPGLSISVFLSAVKSCSQRTGYNPSKAAALSTAPPTTYLYMSGKRHCGDSKPWAALLITEAAGGQAQEPLLSAVLPIAQCHTL